MDRMHRDWCVPSIIKKRRSLRILLSGGNMGLRELRNTPHLSASSVGDYLDCGLLYKFGRIDKLQSEFKPDAMEFGSAIHMVLAEIYEQKMSGGSLLHADSQMFSIGTQCTPPKVHTPPFIAKLKEAAPRKGFFEWGDFIALRDNLPDYLKGLCAFGYRTGRRVSEITNLKWSEVDLNQNKE